MAQPAEAPGTEVTEPVGTEEEIKPAEKTDEPQESHLASLAKKLGHKAKEEFDGPEEKWVPPDEFVARRFEILSERFERTSNKTKTLEKMLESVSSHVSKVEKVAYERAIEDLKQQRRKAIEDGDADQVETIDEKITKVADDLRAEAENKTTPEMSEELQQWLSENKWFNSDSEMTADASVISKSYRERNPQATDVDMLKHVDAKMRKLYPEKFENPKRRNPSPVDSGGSGGGGSGKGYSRADLNDEQRQVHDYYVKAGVMTSADYIKSLIDLGELGGKK